MATKPTGRSTKRRQTGRGVALKKRRITAEDLMRFRFVSDPCISADGRRVLFSRKHVGEKNDYVTNLWMVPAGGGDARQFTSGGKDRHGRFSPDGKCIAFISGREKPKPQIYTIPAEGGEAVALTSFPEGSIQSFRWSPDGTMLAVSYRETEPEWTEAAKKKREETGRSTPPRVIDEMYYRLDGDGYFNSRRFQLYAVDVATGKVRLLFDRDTIGWFSFDWSPDSSELVVSANTSRDALQKPWKAALFRVDAHSAKSRKIPNLPDGLKTAARWSPDGKRIAYAGREGKDIWGAKNMHLYVCDPDQGGPRELIGHTDYCLDASTISDMAEVSFETNIRWSPDSKRIFKNLGWHGEQHVASIGVDGGKIAFHTKGRQTVCMGNFSNDGSRVAMTVATQSEPAEIAVGCFPTRGTTGSLKTARLSNFNKWLSSERELAEAEPHWIESASGTKVHLWVMKPIGFRPTKKYPAVLEVHGGPHAQYGESYFHEFQVLAAAGYVVVYSNPRGSKGYGEDHCNAIKGNWGHADWEDIQAVTAFMKELPFVSPKRMGITGGSYGGYMTNWAVGHTNDFAAAITDRCVSNLVSMVGSSDFPLVPDGYWQGNSWDNTTGLWEQSPLKYFGNVQTPVLIIHSEGDLRCNVEQAEQVFAALKLRGIPTRFVRYPAGTSHGMSRMGPADLRFHRLEQILEWWKRHLS